MSTIDQEPPPATVTRRGAAGSAGFISCLVLLCGLTAAFHLLTGQMHVIKKPVPLKKPLNDLVHAALSPYKVERVQQIPAETIDRLGTRDYIQWILSDPDRNSPLRGMPISLFVTYYTGQPDQVPHVPDECYVGSGFKIARDAAPKIAIPALGPEVAVPFTLLEFERDDMLRGKQYTTVMYTFKANDSFTATRDGVRSVLGDPGATHAYYCKVEVSTAMPSDQPIGQEAFVEGMTDFLQVVIPVLVRDHWPDDADLIAPVVSGNAGEPVPTTTH